MLSVKNPFKVRRFRKCSSSKGKEGFNQISMPHVSMVKGRVSSLFVYSAVFHVQFQGFLLHSALTEFPLGYIPEFIIYDPNPDIPFVHLK